MTSLETVRWADQQRLAVAIGATGVRSRELFRVQAPFPTTWRILAGAQAEVAGNFPLPLRLVVNIGIGSFVTQAFFDIAFNATYNFEIPGQVMGCFFQVNAAVVAADNFTFGAGISPNIPWEGMKVLPVR